MTLLALLLAVTAVLLALPAPLSRRLHQERLTVPSAGGPGRSLRRAVLPAVLLSGPALAWGTLGPRAGVLAATGAILVATAARLVRLRARRVSAARARQRARAA